MVGGTDRVWIARWPGSARGARTCSSRTGCIDPEIEARTLQIAPAVFHAHAYYGTCISGAKTFKSPTTMPCSRRFGWPCLVNYYPRRCGGWSPITMVREFRRQAERLQLLSQYKALVTYSAHMQREFARHGIHATCVGAANGIRPCLCQRPCRSETLVTSGGFCSWAEWTI